MPKVNNAEGSFPTINKRLKNVKKFHVSFKYDPLKTLARRVTGLRGVCSQKKQRQTGESSSMGKNKLKPPARTWRKVSLQITSIQDQAVGLACRWHHCWGYKRRTCRIAGTTRRWKTKHQRGHRSEMVTGWECRPPPLPFWSTREKEAFHYTRSSSIKDERPASLAVFMKHSISHILYCSPIALHGFLSSLSLVGTFISSSMRRHPQCIKFDPEALHLCDWLTAVPSTTRLKTAS